MDWFRMYGDMPDDPKIGTLSDAEFRTWVELLCAACKAGDEGNTKLTKETINWALRRDVTETVTTLSQRELVTINGDGEYIIKAWQKRQYKTDSSTERTRKYRENKKSKLNTGADIAARSVTVTGAERHSDAIEQNRTDTEYKETTLSGNPDAVTPEKKEPPEIVQAKEAISHLNEKTGSRYRPVESNLKLVQARLREGYTLSDVKAVIDRQVGQWGQDEKMQEYLRPATLFCASKFASYAGRVKPDEVGWWKVAGFASRFEAENVGCTQFNAAQFHDGQRMEAHA